MRPPDYAGGSIANLVAELEARLGGGPPLPGLDAGRSALVPAADSYVLVLFDGLGDHQLTHPAAEALRAARVAALDACFPSTTVVGLASLATALAPAGHGLVSHFLHLGPPVGIVNALKWRDISGREVDVDTSRLLPETVWERLAAAGAEPVTVQPGAFEGTPLSRALYRGARFEPVWSPTEWVDATVDLSSVPGRLVLAYWPSVDLAGHVAGQRSTLYRDAMAEVDGLWSRLVARLPAGVVAVATADHGHVDYGPDDRVTVDRHGATTFGDPRALFLRTDDATAARLAAELPVTLVDDPRPLFGPGDHPDLATRLPTHVLLADPGRLVIPSFMDDRLVGMHGGLEAAELSVPLLVGEGAARA